MEIGHTSLVQLRLMKKVDTKPFDQTPYTLPLQHYVQLNKNVQE